MTGAPLVVRLADAAGLGRDQTSGKADTLAELAAAGLPVPPGFVVPAAGTVTPIHPTIQTGRER